MSIIVLRFLLLLYMVCLILPVSILQELPDITMLTKYEPGKVTYRCVGGSNINNSPLTFLTPLNLKYAEKSPSSTYLPDVSTNCQKFNCDFEKRPKVKSWITNGHAIMETGVHIIEPALDERWEKFAIYYTENNQMKQVSFITNQENMAISIRSESEVYIYLCDANVDDNGLECYIITITNNKPTSNIHMKLCSNVNEKMNYQAQLNCTTWENGMNGTLKLDWWGHYKISAESKGNDITVYELGLENPVLQYSHTQRKSINKIFISSQSGAFWKIHNYKYLKLNITDKYKSIGPGSEAVSNSGTEQRYVKWQHVRLIGPIISGHSYRLQMRESSNTSGFWAIDDVRECNVNESRKIEMTVDSDENEVFCQALNYPNFKVSSNGNMAENPDVCNDIENIGLNCNITCKSIIGEDFCNGHRICKLTTNGNGTICTCAPGYIGDYCNMGCDSGKYGYKCEHQCGHCLDQEFCMKSTGNCPRGCENGYKGLSCDTLVYPCLKQPPKILQATLTTVTVQLDKIATYGQQNADKFQLQYSTDNATWKNSSFLPSTLIKGANETIENLDPVTKYLIRAVLYTSDGNSYRGTQVPSTEATTECKDFPKHRDAIKNIEFIPYSHNITIKWTPVCKMEITLSVKCMQNKWCKEEIEDYNISSIKFNYTITGLTPYTTYQMSISDFNKNYSVNTIVTCAYVPPFVGNLTVYSRSESYLSVRWKPPFPPHGELEHYKLTYRKCEDFEAISTFIEPTPCKLWDIYVCHNITNLLQQDQCYKVAIYVKNRNVPGYNETIVEANTKQNRSGAPTFLTYQWTDQDQLTLNWTHPFITNGNLKSFVILLESTVGMETEYNEIYEIREEERNYSYKIQSNIRLSTIYNISVFGKNLHDGEPATIIVITPPATPALLTNITVGTRTNTTQDITIPGANRIASDSSYVYVVLCDPTQESSTAEENSLTAGIHYITKQTNCPGTAWIAANLTFNGTDIMFTVGNNATMQSERFGTVLENKALKPDVMYQVNVVLENSYNSTYRYKVYSAITSAPLSPEPEPNSALYALFLLLLLPAIIWFIYRRREKTNRETTTRTNDQRHIGISLTSIKNSLTASQRRENISNKNESGTVTQPLLQNRTNDENPGHSCVVTIGNLADYIKKSVQNGGLENQHKLFASGPTKPWDYGMLKENKFKNRYTNLSAYDESRVILKKIHSDPHSDFINANYIDGYQQSKAYIATQGPKITTINDFWRMIWQENVTCIVMLANLVEGGKKKCEEYWPATDTSREFVNILVTCKRTEIFADYKYRTFEVQHEGKTRILQQLHFTSWPDHGVPLYPQTLVPFLKKLLTFSSKNAPIVVHCSAGVGRTGTIILCDICLRMAAKEKAIDALFYLQKIREHRANMVDNISQYQLVHMVLLELLTAPNTNMPCENLSKLVKQLIDDKQIEKQMAYLRETAWQYSMTNIKESDESILENASKNRFLTIIPENSRIYLKRFPVDDENSDYINAVSVDGFRCKEQFIVTQTPLPHTVGDFWRMIDEQEVTVILSLNEIDVKDKISGTFWPCEPGIMNPVPFLTVKYISLTHTNLYDTYIVQLESKHTKEAQLERNVTIIQFNGWKQKNTVPNSVHDMISSFCQVESLFRNSTPVVVSCYDGATGCGLFVALSFIIEKIKLEQNVDVSLAVRVIRKNRIQFVDDEKQFEFLYHAAVAYVDSFEMYANFQGLVKK